MIEQNWVPLMTKQRIESLRDNIFSIVMTSFVFSFKLPNLSGPNLEKEFYYKLFELLSAFFSYILSFATISIFWVAHHHLFQIIHRTDAKLLWINNLFLLWIALLPFPAQVIGAYPDREPAVVLFGLVMTLALLSFSLLRYYVFYHSQLVKAPAIVFLIKKSLIKGVIGSTCYILAIFASVISEDITLTMYALIPFIYFIPASTYRLKEINAIQDKNVETTQF